MYTPIQLDKMRNLRYGMKAQALIERKFGKALALIDFETLTVDEENIILWAGLVHEDQEITPEKLLDILDTMNKEDLTVAGITLMRAIIDAYGPAPEVNESENPNQAVAE